MINKIQADCPECGQGRTKVVCTRRTSDKIIIRRRKCIVCEHRWYSVQYPEVPVSDHEIKWIGTGSNATFQKSA